MQTATRSVIFYSRASGSRRVFIGIPNVLCRSNIRWRGRSFAASVPSNSSKPQKVQRKISKHERRTMLEAFVDEYKASNAGKFPTVSLAQQHIGGSFYTIRQILQELEYESKNSPISKREEVCLEKVEKVVCAHSKVREGPLLTEVEDVSSSDTMASCTSQPSDVKANASVSVKMHRDQGKLEITEDVLQSIPGNVGGSKEDESASRTSQDANGSKKIELKGNQEDPKSEDFHGVISSELEQVQQSPKGSTVWASLKSFADGIINLWKKK